jgi:hypothetical protein
VAHEIHEHIEHAGHGDHHGGPASILPQLIGITIAILGVLLALCSAQLGAARTELLATMNEANDTSAKHQTISTKTLMLMANTAQLVALQPDEEDFKKSEEELKKLEAEMKEEHTKLLYTAMRHQTDKILNTVTPTEEVINHFAENIRTNEHEEEAAEKWAESYEDAVKVHAHTADHFELALVSTEIGIVIASVGLLLSKKVWFARALWGIALILGMISLSIAGWTKYDDHGKLHEAETKIVEAKKAYEDLVKSKKVDEDEEMLRKIEKTHKDKMEKEKKEKEEKEKKDKNKEP